MQFQHSEWLHGFWIVLLFLLFFFWAGKRKKSLLEKFGKWKTLKSLIESHSQVKEKLKKALLLGVLSLLVVTMAQPQWGETKKEIQRKGVEVMFLVDTSLSMLAEDVSPSRIGKAKLEMKAALRQLKGDRI
ncbi:MAG: VWA domain-containing protein, partial [Candidatus Omnitrophica bacterium]|nr:VWA domain-containing protein [Candidatus Omnitrophota bacterium]